MDETYLRLVDGRARGGTRVYGLEPDVFVLGKPIAGGVPASVWGFTDDVAQRPCLEQALHLSLVNRGSPIGPFHNMMLACPKTSAGQVRRFCDNFDEVISGAAFRELPT